MLALADTIGLLLDDEGMNMDIPLLNWLKLNFANAGTNEFSTTTHVSYAPASEIGPQQYDELGNPHPRPIMDRGCPRLVSIDYVLPDKVLRRGFYMVKVEPPKPAAIQVIDLPEPEVIHPKPVRNNEFAQFGGGDRPFDVGAQEQGDCKGWFVMIHVFENDVYYTLKENLGKYEAIDYAFKIYRGVISLDLAQLMDGEANHVSLT